MIYKYISVENLFLYLATFKKFLIMIYLPISAFFSDSYRFFYDNYVK